MTWTIADTNSSIPERFERQALLHPGKVAVAGTAWQPTYAELDAAANRLARLLLARGARAGTRVALLLAHDAPMIAAMLAVLKSGAAVVVLNASDPPARLEQLRAQTAPALLLTDAEHHTQALGAGFAKQEIVTLGRIDRSPHPAPDIRPDQDDLATLMCTSGSTGRPVAVAQSHRNILHNVLRHTNGLGLRAEDRIVLLASPSGGQGAGTVWTALLNGATLCPFPVIARGVAGLAGWLTENGVTVFVASASLFRRFAATLDGERMAGIRLVRLGSEQALHGDYELWRRHFSPEGAFANTYSSSETGSIAHHLMSADAEPAAGQLPAGHVADDVEVLVLGEDGGRLEAGEIGEIVVRARHISPGYWGQDELTQQRFSRDREGFRSFRTGDLGSCEEDGTITLHGRRDSLVKVRGNRVSLSEVETALSASPGVASAVVLASEAPGGETRMTAYVVRLPALAPAAGDLRRELRARLPEHAVPRGFVFLEQLPLTAHGKVDREALARVQPTDTESHDVDVASVRTGMPAGEVEELIATLWARALGREVGREQDFFDLGGDSLAAAGVAVAMQEALGVRINMRVFAARPTIAGLAGAVYEQRAMAAGEPEEPIAGAAGAGLAPASLAQERMWRLCMAPGAGEGYTIASALRIRGALDVQIMRRCIDFLIHRHEALRMTFLERDGTLLQVVHTPAPLDVPLIDLSGVEDPRGQAGSMLRKLAAPAFDLERGPLLRLQLVRLGPDEHVLHRVHHHIISDGGSWSTFSNEEAVLYEALLAGEPPPLAAEMPVRYGDVAAWERRRSQPGGRRHRELLARWRELASREATAPPFARPAALTGVAPPEGTISWGLPLEVAVGLERLGRELSATFYMVRLAIFAALLADEADERELLLGTYVSTRRQPETQGMFGCFTHLAPLLLSVPEDASVAAWMRSVREAVLEVNDVSDLPYEQVAEELARTGVVLPGIRTLFALHESQRTIRYGGLEVSSPEHTFDRCMPSGFSFIVNRWREADRSRTDFDANIYDPPRVRAFVERFRRLAADMCGGGGEQSLRELVERSAEDAPELGRRKTDASAP